MKKLIAALFSLTLLSACSTTSDQKQVVAIAQIVEHTSLNTIRESMLEELENLGYNENNLEIIYKNAQGDASALPSILQNFTNADTIVAIATPTAMAAAPYAKNTPVVFSAVSYPILSGLTSSLEQPDQNITGTSDEVQVDQILDLALTLTPDIKTLGILYNSGEANSVENIKKAKVYCEEHDIAIEEITISSISELNQAANVLATKVDAIFTPNDNTVASAQDVLNKACIEANIPLYVGADSMVNDGGLATVGISYEELGKATAQIIDQILKGKDVKDIPIQVFKDNLNIYINKTTAEKLNINLPEDLLAQSNTIIME